MEKYNLSVPRGATPKKFMRFINKLIDISSKAISEYLDEKIIKGY